MSRQSEKNEKKEKRNKKRKKNQAKSWWRKPKAIRFTVTVILSILAFFISFFWVPGEIHYRIRETYSYNSAADASLHLNVLLPASGSTQEISDPDVDWPGTWQVSDADRLQILTMETPVQENETVRAVITYQVILFQGDARWVDDPVTDAETGPSPEIQSDAQEIVDQAESLRVNDDEERTLLNIFEFVVDDVEYTRDAVNGQDESALTALQIGEVNDKGRANLLAALNRADGLPARAVNGLRLRDSIPFIPVTGNGVFPGQSTTWNEVYYDSAWGLVDPNLVSCFFKPAALGWTDGKHLAYAATDQEAQVYQGLLENLAADGQWQSSSMESLRYVAWADVDQDQVEFTSKVTVIKTWDARWLMLISLIVIIYLMAWLMQADHPRKRLVVTDI